MLAYNERKVEQGMGYVLDTNISYGKTVDMTQEFNIVRQLRPRLGKAVYHVSLNLPYEDTLSDKEFLAFGNDYLKGMGFDDNQYIMYRHSDQEHEHIHIIANRVKFSGELVSDSKDYERSERLVRKLEVKYDLSQLKSKGLQKKAPITQQEIEKAIRTGEAPIKLIMQQRIERALLNSNNIEDFISNLNKRKVYPMFNASLTTGRVTGISFDYQGVIYKGSTLGRKYSWNNIIKKIDYEQERDLAIILEYSQPSQRNTRDVGAIKHGPKRAIETPTGIVKQRENTHEKPDRNLRKDRTMGWIRPLVDGNPWNAFKLELEEQDRNKRKRKRGRRRF